MIIGIHIYIYVLIASAIFKIFQVFINEIANPILGFTVYNPDKKVIKDFTKNELQIYTNSMFLIDGLRHVLTVMISISQIDIAIFDVVITEAVSIITVRIILNEKQFICSEPDKDDKKEEEKWKLIEIV